MPPQCQRERRKHQREDDSKGPRYPGEIGQSTQEKRGCEDSAGCAESQAGGRRLDAPGRRCHGDRDGKGIDASDAQAHE